MPYIAVSKRDYLAWLDQRVAILQEKFADDPDIIQGYRDFVEAEKKRLAHVPDGEILTDVLYEGEPEMPQ
jgi:hypothetical protein